MLRPWVAILVSAPLAAGAPQSIDTGRVAGTVKLTHVKGTPLASSAYPGRTVGDRQTAAGPDLRDVVGYIKDAPPRTTLSARTAELKQEHEAFVPHVVAITRGSTVTFPNGDPFFHNVFSLSSAANFDLGRYTTGKTVTQTFSKTGIVKVFCKIHSHMSATILVFDHPYFVIPGADGSYELPALPPGDYTVVGWHERVGERTVPVTIERGRTATIDLSLPIEDKQ